MRKGICIYRKYFLLKRIILIKNLVTLHLKLEPGTPFFALWDATFRLSQTTSGEQSSRVGRLTRLHCSVCLYFILDLNADEASQDLSQEILRNNISPSNKQYRHMSNKINNRITCAIIDRIFVAFQ